MFKDYCIIGNAPNEIGRNRGNVIDEFEQCFRFNNFSLKGFESDYGCITTHWVTTFAKDIIPRDVNNLQIICPLPLNVEMYLKRYNYTNLQFLDVFKGQTEFIPETYFSELLSYIDNPSTGISLLFWIHREVGLDPERIFGFNFFNKKSKHHYFDKNTACLHKGDLERDLFEKMINKQI